MSIVETSVVLRARRGAWLAVLLWIRESNLARWYLRAEQAVARAFRGSRIFTVLFRRGAVLRAWEGSLACRALTAAAGLIPRGLRRLYLPLRDIWEGSAAFRIAGALGNNVGVILSWFFLLLTACPHRYWNNLYTLAAVLVCTALLFFACARTGAPRLEVGRLNPYLWAFVFMLFVGVAESSSRRVSLRYLMFFLSAILLCLLALSAADSVERLRRMAAFGCAGMIPSALYGAYQLLVLGVTNTSSTVDLTLNAEMPGRVSSYFDNPNTYAQVLVMLLGVGLGLLFACRTVRGRIACLVCLGFGAAGILMTYSRASWVGLACAMAVLPCCRRCRRPSTTASSPSSTPRTAPPPAASPFTRWACASGAPALWWARGLEARSPPPWPTTAAGITGSSASPTTTTSICSWQWRPACWAF